MGRGTRWRWIVPLLSFLLLASPAAAATWTHTPIDVAATSTAVYPANPNRLHPTVLQNDSDVDMYCDLTGNPAVLHQGVRLLANGGNWVSDAGNPPKSAIACIHNGSGGKRLLGTEVTGP